VKIVKTHTFKITIKVDGVSSAELRDYVTDACERWGKQFHPDNPLFDLDENRVRVTRLQVNKKKGR
jgi:hypothetical protein